MIPKIVKYHLNLSTKNIVQNFINDKSYFITPNEFNIKSVRIGPFNSSPSLNIKICDFTFSPIEAENITRKVADETINGRKYYYYLIEFSRAKKISSDIRISVSGGGVSFSFWSNFWYSTLNIIKVHIQNFQKNLLISGRIKDKEDRLEGKINIIKLIFQKV
jgi:hypothetical protein